jgi:hypothetical protein
MTPGKFIAYQERRLGRALTDPQRECIDIARAACAGGKRNTVKAMWLALDECLQAK